jgi:hypothetical protein
MSSREIKVGDRVRVETITGGGLYGKVMGIGENKGQLTYFVMDSKGKVSVHNEIDTGLTGLHFRHFEENEPFPEPPAPIMEPQPVYEYEKQVQPIPETPSFQKGQMIRSSKELWEVTEVFKEDDTLEITPLELSPHMETYITKGEKYRLIKHNAPEMGKGGIWEIPAENMDRSSSQVLLYLWEDTGPSIEIDF